KLLLPHQSSVPDISVAARLAQSRRRRRHGAPLRRWPHLQHLRTAVRPPGAIQNRTQTYVPREQHAMTTIGDIIQPSADETNIGVHPVDQFVLTVPDLQRSEHFYKSFGLDVVESGNVLLLNTFGHEHCWGTLVKGPDSRLHHHSFGCHSWDLEPLRNQVEGSGIRLLDPPAGFDDGDAFWFRDPEGILIEVRVAPKTSLDHKNSGPWMSSPEGVAG